MNIFQSKKNLLIILLVLVIGALVWWVITKGANQQLPITDDKNDEVIKPADGETTDDLMTLTVFLQDKQAAITSDCGITYPKDIEIPKTKAVADASLTWLFENELSQYGDYVSVVIKDGIAEITLTNDNDPSGRKISSLSSCESRHLISVLYDTLTQYDTIDKIELFSPAGKIEF